MWKNMPAVAAGLLVCAGTVAARGLTISWRFWGAGAVLFLLLSVFLYLRSRKIAGRELFPSIVFPLLLFCSASLFVSVEEQLLPPAHISRYLSSVSPFRLCCEIADEPRLIDNKLTTLVHVLSIGNDRDSLPAEGDALLTVVPDRRHEDNPVAYSYGSLITFSASLEMPMTARNPGEFSYRDYLALNGIFATIRVQGFSRVTLVARGHPNPFFRYVIFPSKHFVLDVVNGSMTGDEANFLVGLLLGDRTDMSREIKTAFINTGTIHVLAVSGSHVVLVVAIIYTLFGLLRLSERWKNLATIGAIVYYMELTGATPSVVRASLMAIVVLLSKLFQEKTNVYNSLGVSAALLLAYDPLQMYDAGFQLSYAAVFSMAYFYPKLKTLIKKIPESLEEVKGVEFVLELGAISLAAQIGTIPFTAYFFGRVSIVSLVANLVVVPLVEFIVTIGFISVLAAIASGWVAACFTEANKLLTWFTLKFVLLANAVPHATIPTPSFGLEETFFYGLGVALLFGWRSPTLVKRCGALLIAGLDFALLSSIASQMNAVPQNLRVSFIDVGQGDAALIEFPTGERYLIDAGPKTLNDDAGERIVAPFLRKKGISMLTAIVVTHPHSDHLGGVPFLLRSVGADEVLDGSQRAQSDLYYDYESLIPRIHRVVSGGMLLARIPGVRLYTLHPVPEFLEVDSANGFHHLNNSSVVVKLQYGHTSFMLVGDAEIPVENHLDSVYGTFLKSDILKAGHHGSSTSSSEEFLRTVNPREVVVSVGRFNKFHHPSQKVLARFRSLGILIHRTDEEGAIVYESDGEAITRINWRRE
ncbi:MAG TPA: DNA internalization-related competence protein ComEC/Rec2 [Bacteroidota bacterium]|nr:DNA internalization-related competence protein ComEC/Rec2 [Bacteroidota bacterium]